MAVKGPVMESAINFMLWQSLLVITFHAFTVTGSEKVCDGAAFFASDLDKV